MSTQQSNATENARTDDAPALIGRYEPPEVREGDRVYCRYRKAWCRVTGWGTGPIRWPRVQQIGVRGQPGLLVDETLERAIRTESAVALAYWLGLSRKPVSWWRRAFGVGGHAGTHGTRALQSQKGRTAGARVTAGAARVARAPAAPKAPTAPSQPAPSPVLLLAGRVGLWGKRQWSPTEVALLGTDRDEVVAAALGRSPAAVTWQRCYRGIPAFRRPKTEARPWTAADVARLGTDTDEAVAARIDRTAVAVTSKRIAMRLPPFVPLTREPATRSRSRGSFHPSTRSTGART